MLSVIMKRNLTKKEREDLENTFIKLSSNEVKLSDGFVYRVYQTTNDDGNNINISISVYFEGMNVSNMIYNHIYYKNVMIPMIRSALGIGTPSDNRTDERKTITDAICNIYKYERQNSKKGTIKLVDEDSKTIHEAKNIVEVSNQSIDNLDDKF